MRLDERLEEKLHNRRNKGLYRSLHPPGDLIDFTSNDYLGLAGSEALHKNINKTLASLPVKNGATGSRLLSGNSFLATETEQKLAAIFRSQASLIFNSGYTANLAVLSAIPGKDDTILYDELAHASIKDGARLSLAKKFSFRHNDLADLEKKLGGSKGKVFVVVESVYSMDGDECPLEALVRLSEKYQFSIVLDEAHSTGTRGEQGSGIAVEANLHDKIDIRIYTFGKAMGVCGACVCGSASVVDYLINFARPFIYTTGPSQYQLASIGCAFDLLNENISLQGTLKHKTDLFLSNAAGLKNRTESRSAIQTFLMPGNENVRETARQIRHLGFDVRPILSPTVPEGKERLRICLHTFNNNDDITKLVHTLHAIEETTGNRFS